MARWHGFPPQTPAYSVQTTATDYSPTSPQLRDADAEENPWRSEPGGPGVRWWSHEGVDVLARHCHPLANAHRYTCDPGNDDPDCVQCANPLVACNAGGFLNFQSFDVDAAIKGCTHPVNGIDYAQLVVEQLDVDQWAQIGKAIVLQPNGLAQTAIDLSGGSATTMGIAHLSQVYSDVGFGIDGVLVMPSSAVDTYLEHGGVIREGGRLTTAGGTPVVSGAGIANVGPGNLAAPAGHAWIYITPHRPVVAVHPRNKLTFNGQPISSDQNIRSFWDPTLSCFEPGVRRDAIAVTSPCANYAMLVDLRECLSLIHI